MVEKYSMNSFFIEWKQIGWKTKLRTAFKLTFYTEIYAKGTLYRSCGDETCYYYAILNAISSTKLNPERIYRKWYLQISGDDLV